MNAPYGTTTTYRNNMGTPNCDVRPQTKTEASATERAAIAGCAKAGIPVQRCKVDFYGEDSARVTFINGPLSGKAVMVSGF